MDKMYLDVLGLLDHVCYSPYSILALLMMGVAEFNKETTFCANSMCSSSCSSSHRFPSHSLIDLICSFILVYNLYCMHC